MIYLKKIFSLIIFNLIIPCLYSQVIEQKWNRPINYNEKLVSKYILPDALTCIDGTKITNIIEWEQKCENIFFSIDSLLSCSGSPPRTASAPVLASAASPSTTLPGSISSPSPVRPDPRAPTSG